MPTIGELVEEQSQDGNQGPNSQRRLRTGRIHRHCSQGQRKVCEGDCWWQCHILSEVKEGEI